MKPDAASHLYDAREAAQAIRTFVAGRTFEQYVANDLLRSGVERKFEIIGEALNRLKRDDPETFAQVCNTREIISFRNILVHGYDVIDDRIVWSVIADDLADLLVDLERLLP